MKRLAALLVIVGCSNGGGEAPISFDAGRTRRVIDPPTGQVRPVPPHAIEAGGLGPYRLGATQPEIFAVLPPPSLPRVGILDVEGVLDVSFVRADDDAVLVGGRPGEPTSFIAVLAPGIARTDSGLAVGARREELGEAARRDPRVARDPRLFVPAALPGARFILDGDRVQAILLRPAGDEKPPRGGCELPGEEAQILAAVGAKAPASVVPACLTSSGKDALVVAGTTVSFVTGDGGKLRRVAPPLELPGLVWAGPVRNDGDRDDVVAIVERRTRDDLQLSLVAVRLEGGKTVKLADDPVYRLTSTSAQWIGARLDDVRLLLHVEGRGDAYAVGGVLVHARQAGVRDVAPLSPIDVARRRRGAGDPPPAPPVDAGPRERRDAGPVDAN